ncbi:MAG: flagellar hook-basal body complex protein [Phycisphaerae bacterium]
MGLTSAMYTSLSGMNVNQTRINTIGNNIANVNTTAFKGSRTLFQTQFSQLLSAGTAPSATSGGVNPTQIGLGALVATTQKNFGAGSIETTGVSSDLAVEGNGLFVVRRSNNQQVYTRDGSFSVDSNNKLVTSDGSFVQGFGVDTGFNVVPGVLTDLTVPLGTLTLANATQNVVMDGDLSAAGTIGAQGSTTLSQALVDGGGAAATANTQLTDVRSASAAGVPLFAAGNTITVSHVTKGDRELPTAQFVIGTTGNTLGDFANWLNSTFGIQAGAGLPGNPGATIQNGALVVESNAGTQNGIQIDANDIVTDNATTPLPFTFTQAADANGSSTFTAFTVYDSLGTPVQVNATMVLDSTPAIGPVWRFYLESPDNAGGARALGNGSIQFDTQGNFLSATGNQVSIDRGGTGAASPLTITVDFSGVHGLSTQTSNVIMALQDGFPPGTMTAFGVGVDGTVTGTFSNGLTRTLGQVVLATFANQEGLLADTENAYVTGPNSGPPTITAPGTLNAGRILSGALELSNVDLSREFIGLITSSTGFQAASRVITVSSDLLDQLLLITR